MNTIYQTKAEALATEQRIRGIVTSAYLGIATTTTTPPPMGAYWYKVGAPGTYMGVTVTEADFKDEEGNYFGVTLEVNDGVVTKSLSAKIAPDNAKIVTWTPIGFPSGSQVVYNNAIFESNAATTSDDIPGLSYKWVGIGESLQYSEDSEVIFKAHPTVPTYMITDKIQREKGDTINIKTYGGTSEKMLVIYNDSDEEILVTCSGVGLNTLTDFNYTFLEDGFFVAVSAKISSNVKATIKIKKNYLADVQDIKTVLDSFLKNKTDVVSEINPTDQLYSVLNEVRNGSFGRVSRSGFASFGFNLLYVPDNVKGLKIEGDFNDFSDIMWAGAYKEPVYSVLKIGALSDSSFEIIFDRSLYEVYVFSYKMGVGNYKISLISEENSPPTFDSVKKLILSNSGGSGGSSDSLDAFFDYDVSPSNSAEVNSLNLNTAITAAYDQKKKLILPAGVIGHNGINYKEGVHIIGAGMPNTILKSMSAVSAIKDTDVNGTNRFNGGSISDLTINGNSIGLNGLELSHNQGFFLQNVFIQYFTNYGSIFKGQLQHSFLNTYITSCGNGTLIMSSDNSYFGYMQSNIIQYNNVYFGKIAGLCVDINKGSDIFFNGCNFEECGVSGNENTGAVRATNMSIGIPAIDITFNNCWSEGVKGMFLNISAMNGGTTVIRDTMIYKGGNGGGGSGTSAVINSGSKVLITGSTMIKGFAGGSSVKTLNNGQTRVDGFSNVENHSEESGGSYKTIIYS